MTTSVRFSSLVEAGGQPEIHLAWSAPASDPILQAAFKRHRVLTIHQRIRGAKSDFGVVGLDPARDAQYLIFPRSLRPFTGQRVVGIRYDLLGESVSVGPAPRRRQRRKTGRPSPTATNVIHFPLPGSEPKRQKGPTSPEAQPTGSSPSVSQIEPVETDPLKIEIRKAIADLSAGRFAKAIRRLRGLLA